MDLEEDRFLTRFQQQVQKKHEKEWHDWHIKLHMFKVDDLVLLYEGKFTKFPGKFQMHWLGPYVIKEITDWGAVQLAKLNGNPFPGKVNRSRLKLYTVGLTPAQWLYGSKIVLVIQEVARDYWTINYATQISEKHGREATWRMTRVQQVKLH